MICRGYDLSHEFKFQFSFIFQRPSHIYCGRSMKRVSNADVMQRMVTACISSAPHRNIFDKRE